MTTQMQAEYSPQTSRDWGGVWLIGLASLIGLVAFFYPFLLPVIERGAEGSARAGQAPLLLAGVTALALMAIAVELDRGNAGNTSKTVALLGVLVAIDATLRLAPTLLGASPLFVLIILVGAVFGPSFGFQMGALTLLVSAFLTGGLGPWLPFQMLGAGWVGMTAGWLPRPASIRRRVLLLALFGAAWGFLYGLLLNLWFWPVVAPGVGIDTGLYWFPGMSPGETIERYTAFYLVTSGWYDLFRAAGNALLVLVFGAPLLAVLERFRRRFTWEAWDSIQALPVEP